MRALSYTIILGLATIACSQNLKAFSNTNITDEEQAFRDVITTLDDAVERSKGADIDGWKVVAIDKHHLLTIAKKVEKNTFYAIQRKNGLILIEDRGGKDVYGHSYAYMPEDHFWVPMGREATWTDTLCTERFLDAYNFEARLLKRGYQSSYEEETMEKPMEFSDEGLVACDVADVIFHLEEKKHH